MKHYALHRMPENPLLHALVEQRRALGLSQRELAQMVRRSPVQVHKWEVGKAEPSLRNLENWCDALGFELKISPKD